LECSIGHNQNALCSQLRSCRPENDFAQFRSSLLKHCIGLGDPILALRRAFNRSHHTASGQRIVDFKSVAYDLPILEYRPYRAFSTNQSSSVIIQLFMSADVPRSASTVFPVGAPTPDLRTVWAVGLRLVFDWRYYP